MHASGGRAVAVANAHPAVRAAAPELNSGHDVDGVARYLEAAGLGPRVSDWKPRLIASDMDGTLLHWDETVSAATVAELQRWRADGVPFVLATGRPPRWMRDIREVMRLRARRSAATAPSCSISSASRCSTRTCSSPTCWRTISAELRHRQPDTWFAVEYGMEFRHEPIYRPRWDVDAPGVAPATLDEMVQAPGGQTAGPARAPRTGSGFVALVEDVVGDRATVTNSSSDPLAEISAAGVTKASGLAKIAARARRRTGGRRRLRRHAQRHRRVQWVRDGGGRAVAMERAHADLLAVATDVTGTNDDDGVAAFLAAL